MSDSIGALIVLIKRLKRGWLEAVPPGCYYQVMQVSENT
jgi:hypothetical protein